jgi:hypothetical protein
MARLVIVMSRAPAAVKFNTKAKKEKNPWYNVTLNGQN